MNVSKMNLAKEVRFLAEGRLPIVRATQAWLARQQIGLERLGASWWRRRQRAREVQALATFSDRELWDLGLSRADLPAISDGTYRRD